MFLYILYLCFVKLYLNSDILAVLFYLRYCICRKQHKHHKNESRERYKSPTPNDTNGKNSVTEDVSIEEEEVVYVNKEPVDEPRVADDVESQFVQRGKSDESLSIEETNKIREKLGLKPLNVGNSSTDDPSAKAEFVHAPAADLWKKKKEAEIREKINSRKQKRLHEKKMSKVFCVYYIRKRCMFLYPLWFKHYTFSFYYFSMNLFFFFSL